jgi:outer membrane receptor protein involved in Fe transport
MRKSALSGKLLLAGILLLSLSHSRLLAQSVDTGILGTVTDQSGSVIAGSTVTVTSAATGFNKSLETGSDGNYEIRYLPPGEYTVEARASGFRPERTPGIILQIAQLARVDFKLEVGAMTETVDVAAQGVMLETQDAAIGSVVTTQSVVDLPLNGRSFAQLGNLTPGVVASASTTSPSDTFKANGSRTRYEQISVDGINITNNQENQVTINPNVDAIEEFKIQSGDYSAEYGGNAGANVQVQLKSGSNAFHGSVFDFLRNSDLDARNYFSPPPKPKNILRRNQYGGVISGPVRKDKTFFMFSYEGIHSAQQVPSNVLVLTPAQIAGNFSGSKQIMDPLSGAPFAGNIIPASRLDPVSLSIINTYMPLPNLTGSSSTNYTGSTLNKINQNQYMSRVDQSFGPKDQVFGSYIYSGGSYPSVPLAVQFPALFTFTNQSVASQYVHTFSATTMNELRLGFTKGTQNKLSPRANTGFTVASLDISGFYVGGPNGVPLAPGEEGFPQINISGYLALGDTTGGNGVDYSQTWQAIETFTKIVGSHTLKMGVNIMYREDNADSTNQPYGAYTFSGGLSGNAAADYMLGYPLNTLAPQGIPVSGVRQWQYGFYFQDDWKVSNRLTVNLGARYDLFLIPIDAFGTSRTLRFDLSPSGGPCNCNIYQNLDPILWPNPGQTVKLWLNDYWHAAPRIGLAYRLTNTTVLRAGYGIFTVSPNFDQINTLQVNPPTGAAVEAINPTSNPVATIQNPFPPSLVPTNPVYNVVSIEQNRHHVNPYFEQWNLQVGHEFTKSDVLEVRYVGGNAHFLDSSMLNFNSPPPGPGAIQPRRPYQGYGEVRMWTSDGSSNYNSLQSQYQHRLSHGLNATVSFSWAHEIDNQGGALNASRALAQNPRCPLCNMRASSTDEIPLVLTGGWVWQIPYGSNFKGPAAGIANGVLGGWSLSSILTLQSGSPIFIGQSGDPQNVDPGAGTQSYSEERPNLVPGQNVKLSNPTPNLEFNTAAFSTSVFQFGNSPRNPVFGTALHTLDISLAKSFKIPRVEGHRIMFRIEAFNSLNMPEFSNPGAYLGTSTFGVVTSTKSDNRDVQASLKYVF